MSRLLVTSLRLSHFRSYRSASLEVSRGLAVFHGLNGAGKTNLLEAVSLLSPGRGFRRARPDDMSRRPEGIGWKVSARVLRGDDSHEIDTVFRDGGSRAVSVDGASATQVSLGGVVRLLWLVPSMDRLWVEGADGRRQFLDRMTLSFFPDHAAAVSGYERARTQRNRLLRDGVGDPSWHGAVEAQMARFGASLQRNRVAAVERLNAAGRASGSAFPAVGLSLEIPEGADFGETESDLAEALRLGRRRDMLAGRTLSGPHRVNPLGTYLDKGAPADQCSTGEQKALLLSLLLSNVRALAESCGVSPVLLLDEVAAHLDERRRGDLYAEIRALGVQAWLTGTDPGLFSGLEGFADFFSVSDSGGASEVAPAA